ncbi:hypothetical protein CLV88_102507, partial [Shimia abyssi]
METRLIAMPVCLYLRFCPFWREIGISADR